MSDLIEQALESAETETEREASGCVDERHITIRKKCYRNRDQSTNWKVAVYVDENDYPETQETGLDAGEAEELFRQLCQTHNIGDFEWLQTEPQEWLVDGHFGDSCVVEAVTEDEAIEKATVRRPEVAEVLEYHSIDHTDCDECGGTLIKSSETVKGGGSVADSYGATCIDCGNQQHIASW